MKRVEILAVAAKLPPSARVWGMTAMVAGQRPATYQDDTSEPEDPVYHWALVPGDVLDQMIPEHKAAVPEASDRFWQEGILMGATWENDFIEPNYPASMNACVRDLAPALREHGWRPVLMGPHAPDTDWLCEMMHRNLPMPEDGWPWAEDDNPAMAFVLATLRALDLLPPAESRA